MIKQSTSVAIADSSRRSKPKDDLREVSVMQRLLAQGKEPTPRVLAALVKNGLQIGVLDQLLSIGLTPKELALVAPPRTLAHRRANKQALTSDESDKVIRIGRAITAAERVFADPERASVWLRTSLKRFDGETPMQMLSSEAGGRIVEELLIQIDEGYFA
jgi:putative toxin-antitoxin system antitoxin component (TIGR02293 family)